MTGFTALGRTRWREARQQARMPPPTISRSSDAGQIFLSFTLPSGWRLAVPGQRDLAEIFTGAQAKVPDGITALRVGAEGGFVWLQPEDAAMVEAQVRDVIADHHAQKVSAGR
jgi:hypothetical protein